MSLFYFCLWTSVPPLLNSMYCPTCQYILLKSSWASLQVAASSKQILCTNIEGRHSHQMRQEEISENTNNPSQSLPLLLLHTRVHLQTNASIYSLYEKNISTVAPIIYTRVCLQINPSIYSLSEKSISTAYFYFIHMCLSLKLIFTKKDEYR